MMFSKKKQRPSMMEQPGNPYMMPGTDPNLMNSYSEVMPNNYDMNRLQMEINEMKRQHSELLKRIARLENYLGIRGDGSSSSY